jgi:hydroxypyruvate isomerase
MRRREFLAAIAASGAAAALSGLPARAQQAPIVRKGNIKQGLWRINFGQTELSLEDMCREAQRLGVQGFDLVQFTDIPTLDQYGLKMICTGPGQMDFLTGLIHPEAHDNVETAMKAQADLCAEHGVPGIALNAGQLRGLSLTEAADNAVAACNRIKAHLEDRGVEIWIENVNARRPNDAGLGREDMAFGHWDWGMDVVQRVNSPSVKLLCDIYHLQIMDGDIAWRIRESQQWIGHFHVAGVPTRTEIDATQEVNFRYVAEIIAGLDYDGYVSHEWRPSPGRDPLESLAQAIEIMDV